MSDNHSLIKAVSGGVVAGALNHYMSYGYDTNPNAIRRSAMFGGVVGAGLLSADMIAPQVASKQPSNTHWMSSKTLEHRLIEVGAGTAAVVVFNNYVFRTLGQSTIQVAGLVVLADIAGEYIADYMTSQPLSYFA